MVIKENEITETLIDNKHYGQYLNLNDDPHSLNAAKRKKKDEDEDDDYDDEEKDDYYEEEEEDENPFDIEPSEGDLVDDEFPDDDDDLFDDEDDTYR